MAAASWARQDCFIIFSISEIGGRNTLYKPPADLLVTFETPLEIYNCNVLMTCLDLLYFRRLSLHFRETAAASRARQDCFVIFFQKSVDETSLSEPSAGPSGVCPLDIVATYFQLT
jgi:hypothetical protein